jgi:hypothetical protein
MQKKKKYSKLLARNSKMCIYKSDKTSSHIWVCETWVLRDMLVQQFRVLESKAMRNIYGPIKYHDRSCRIRTNEETDLLIKHANIARYTKARWMRWIGYIVRMDRERMAKRIIRWRPTVVRRIGWTRLRGRMSQQIRENEDKRIGLRRL